MKRIVMTGGGTAGHVTPNFALLDGLHQEGYDIHYIGSKTGIEKELVEKQGILFYGISSGKLRRYKDWRNLTDPFRVLAGCFQATALIRRLKPHVIFSKGGFVAVPVIIAGWLNRVPIVIHESDMTPGLANKISQPFARKICTTFEETLSYLSKDKGIHTGSPIRETLFNGSADSGRLFCNLTDEKPILLMMGGSIGSVKINTVLRSVLPKLLKTHQVIHLCGKGNLDESLSAVEGYRQYEFINKELPDILAASSIVLSRAGSNAISEFLALKKPTILVPLSASASRGDQILNAEAFEKAGYSYVLKEEDLSDITLMSAIQHVSCHESTYIDAMSNSKAQNGVDAILNCILQNTRKF